MCAAAARRVRETASIAIATAIAALWATWPLALRMGDALPAEDRDPLLNAWILAWTAERARHGFHGLWDAPILYPYRHTFAFSEHLLGLAPVSVPLEWVTRNPLVVYNLLFLASYVVAAVGMYLLVVELTGCPEAGVVAAAAFAFCPYRVAQFARLQIEWCGWIAVMMWGLHRYIRSRRRGDLAIAVGAFAIQGLINGYYLYYALVPVVFVAVWAWRTGQLDVATGIRAAVAGGAVLLMVFLPLARIYVQVRQQYDLRRDVADNSRFSADVGSYLHTTPSIRASVAPARWLPDFTKPDGPLETKEGELFPGFVPLLFAIAAPFAFRRSARVDGEAPRLPRRGALVGAWRRDVPIAAASFVVIGIANGWSDAGVSLAVWILLVRSVWPLPRTPAGLYAVIALWAAVLSLGPEPTAWGRLFFPGNPYALLFRIVPGLDGLRVPARLGVITSFALAVVAGLTVARIAARLERSRPRTASGAVRTIAAAAVLVALAGVAAPMPLAAIGQHGRVAADPVYRWLRTQPDGAVLELPVGRMDYNYSGFKYEYATLTHEHPLVNGWTGYSTPLQQFLGTGASPLRDAAHFDDALGLLDGLGVRYVIVHPGDFGDATLPAALLASLRGAAPAAVEAARAGDVVLFRLEHRAAQDTPPACEVRSAPASARASEQGDGVPMAYDGDLGTRWSSDTFQRGSEWFDVNLAQPTSVCGIELLVSPRSIADYPRRLQVVENPGGAVLYEGSVARPFGEAIRRDAARPRIVLSWPPAVTSHLRLRQTGVAPASYWSIDELRLLTRP